MIHVHLIENNEFLTPFLHSTLHIEHFAMPPFKRDGYVLHHKYSNIDFAFIYKLISLLEGLDYWLGPPRTSSA